MSKNIIFMINIVQDERSRNQGYEWSVKSWKHYAQRHDCDLFILEQPLFELAHMKPTWFKMYILDILEANDIDYDQVLYVDCDTIVTPDAPNIFNITDYKFCAVKNFGDMDWVLRSIENYSKYIFDGFMFPYYKYFNGGLMVFNKKHKSMFTSMQQFYHENVSKLQWMQDTYGVGNDQPVVNMFVNRDIADDYKILGYEWNMQDMNRSELIGDHMLHTQYGYICHFNAGIKPTPGYWIEKTYKFLYEN
jgi:lipopolysaccharide biosynthesis glycosyltransferase